MTTTTPTRKTLPMTATGVCLTIVVVLFGAGFIGGYAAASTIIGADTVTEPQVQVLCNNLSANDGPDSPERDITAQEWATYCEGE